MSGIIGRFLIFLVCALIQFQIYPVDTVYIVSTLIALSTGFFSIVAMNDFQQTPKKRLLLGGVLGIYMIVALFLPQLLIFLPLLIFDLYSYRLYINWGLTVLVCILSLTRFFNGLSPNAWLANLLFCCVSLYIQYQEQKNVTLTQQMKFLRDNSKEHQLIIEEKNKTLRDNQDANIYMATLKERNRIAREIHDNVGHMLTRSILQTGAIQTINTNQALAQPLSDLHETLNTAMTSIRNSVHDLHDESVDLLSAIHEIADSVDKFSIYVDYDMGKHVDKSIKYCFISVTKEAVNNAIKHSNASHMDILLREHPGFYQLLISDNGTSINMEQQDGMGLTNMQDRVKALQGNMKITTDDGFKILISIFKKSQNEKENES